MNGADYTSEFYAYAWSAWRTAPPFVRQKLALEDAIQEAAMHCWRVRDSFQEGGMKRYAYMVLCARRHLVQLAYACSRQKNAAHVLSLDWSYESDPVKSEHWYADGSALMAFLSANTPDPAELAAQNDEVEQLRAAMQDLPPRERYTMEHRHILGCTLEQVGQDLGTSREWARQLEAKAMRKLTATLSRGRIEA